MSDDKDKVFEQRLRNLLQKTDIDEYAIPPLTKEKLDALRAMVSSHRKSIPELVLAWERISNKANNFLRVVRATGLINANATAPVMRGDNDTVASFEMVSLPLSNGELRVQVLPTANHKAKLQLSIKGQYTESDALSVELSLGNRLIEARPLERKVEFSINNTGNFSVGVFSGEREIGRMNIIVGETKDPADGG